MQFRSVNSPSSRRTATAKALRLLRRSARPVQSTMAKRMFARRDGTKRMGRPMFPFLVRTARYTRLRKLVSKAFVPKVVNELTPHIPNWSTG